jgi:hypothetical protein
MTEAEWLACRDPWRMLEGVRDLRGERDGTARRKVRLFACACCRPILAFLGPECRQAVEASERYADGTVSCADYRAAWRAALSRQAVPSRDSTRQERWSHLATVASNPQVWDAALQLTRMLTAKAGWAGPVHKPVRTDRQQVALLRDVFSNPFRPVALAPAWRTWNDGAIPTFAQGVYEDRAFDRLPILADMLEDAGCTDRDILDHCRSGGEHVRGCWVVDLLLGKG